MPSSLLSLCGELLQPAKEKVRIIAKNNAVIFFVIKPPYNNVGFYSLPSSIATAKPATAVTAVIIYAENGIAPA